MAHPFKPPPRLGLRSGDLVLADVVSVVHCPTNAVRGVTAVRPASPLSSVSEIAHRHSLNAHGLSRSCQQQHHQPHYKPSHFNPLSILPSIKPLQPKPKYEISANLNREELATAGEPITECTNKKPSSSGWLMLGGAFAASSRTERMIAHFGQNQARGLPAGC